MLLIASQNTATDTERVYQHLQSVGSSRARSPVARLPVYSRSKPVGHCRISIRQCPRVTYCDYCLAAVT